MAEIGKYRPARLVKTGYHIRLVDGTWVAVTQAARITAPLRVAMLWIHGDDQPHYFAGDDEVFSRTPAEVRRAAQVQEVSS